MPSGRPRPLPRRRSARREREALAVSRREGLLSTPVIHQVHPDRGHRPAIRGDGRHHRSARSQRLASRPRRPSARNRASARSASGSRRSRRSGSGRGPGCRDPRGAASRLVIDHTPPSTYSRPSIVTGVKIHGTAQDAATASRTSAGGEPGLPKMTRRPLARSTAATRSRPSKRDSGTAQCRSHRVERSGGTGNSTEHQPSGSGSARLGEPKPDRCERRAEREAPRADGTQRPGHRRARRGRLPTAHDVIDHPPRAVIDRCPRATVTRAPKRPSCRQPRHDDRSGGGSEEMLAAAELERRRHLRCRRGRPPSMQHRRPRRRRGRACPVATTLPTQG